MECEECCLLSYSMVCQVIRKIKWQVTQSRRFVPESSVEDSPLCNSVSSENKEDSNETISIFSRPLYYILLLFLQS